MENEWGVGRQAEFGIFGFMHKNCSVSRSDRSIENYRFDKGITWIEGWNKCWWCDKKPPNWILFQVRLLNEK